MVYGYFGKLYEVVLYIGYFDINERNISLDEQRCVVSLYAKETNVNPDISFCSSDFKTIFSRVNSEGHTVIVPNIVCLGNKLEDIKDNLSMLFSKKLSLISIKEKFFLKPEKNIQLLIDGVNLAINIRASMVSTITKKALCDKKTSGAKLGFPLGQKKKNTITERNKHKISQMFHDGKSKQEIAKEIGCSISLISKYFQVNSQLKTTMKGKNKKNCQT